jgi:hypothetical protein
MERDHIYKTVELTGSPSAGLERRQDRTMRLLYPAPC